MNNELKDKYLTRIIEIATEYGWDEDVAHKKMDDLLCELLTELGFDEIVKVFEAQSKWYA